jgi:general secretion pathway protein C
MLAMILLGACGQQDGSTLPIGADPSLSRYRLAGIAQEDSEHAFAVFENIQTKQQRLYQVGEAIEGATVVEIKPREVVLKRGEEVFVVRLTQGSPGHPVEAKAANVIPVPLEVRDPKQALAMVLSKQIPPYDPRAEKKAVSRDQVNRLVEHFQQQREEEADWVETSLGPALSVAGLDQAALNSLGLKPGDLIVGISGMGIDSLERLQQIVDVLGRAQVFNLSVLRGQVVEPLSYEIQSDV